MNKNIESSPTEIVRDEQFQNLETRKHLYEKIEKLLDLPVVAFYTSFIYPVMIEDNDAIELESFLKNLKFNTSFTMLLNSPGGSGLAAERIINICRTYSGTGRYSVIVPGKAKSAATMICFGSEKIYMGTTAELGTIDPQLSIIEDGKPKWFSLHNLVKSYEKLFNEAVNTKGNLQPYLLQLSNYDAREIEEFRSAIELSNDIAIKYLKTGMLLNKSEEEIKSYIEVFLNPESVKDHGRPINANEVKNFSLLNVEVFDKNNEIWDLIYELHVRINNFVSTNNRAKCIECKSKSLFSSFDRKS